MGPESQQLGSIADQAGLRRARRARRSVGVSGRSSPPVAFGPSARDWKQRPLWATPPVASAYQYWSQRGGSELIAYGTPGTHFPTVVYCRLLGVQSLKRDMGNEQVSPRPRSLAKKWLGKDLCESVDRLLESKELAWFHWDGRQTPRSLAPFFLFVPEPRYLAEQSMPLQYPRTLVDYLKTQGVRYVMVGHTPHGNAPTVIRHDSLTLIMADTSFSDLASCSANGSHCPMWIRMLAVPCFCHRQPASKVMSKLIAFIKGTIVGVLCAPLSSMAELGQCEAKLTRTRKRNCTNSLH